MAMARIRLIHWKPEECPPRAGRLSLLGHQVDSTQINSSSMKEFRENPPDAVVIDLDRLPSHGREVAVALRSTKSTRLIPLIFVEGEAAPEKLERIKQELPDARFTTYAKIGPVLDDVLANPPREAYVPKPHAPAPLAKKLGCKEGQPTGLINAPKGFKANIPGAIRDPKTKVPLSLWFVQSRAELEAALPKMREKAEDGGLWIVWPKATKDSKPDINGNIVRETTLTIGLVDFKICAVDETWSAMRFAVRRSPPPPQQK
jgi:CheY-like chemotaxis protein